MPKHIHVNISSIGRRIRELRQKKKLSQAELARRIGCAPNTITEWEKRKGRAPGKVLITKVAHALEVTVDYLLGIQKPESLKIPCYGEFLSMEFDWPDIDTFYYIEVSSDIYKEKRFALKIKDEHLRPMLLPQDYGIFEREPPKDGDIVIVRFSESNRATVKIWRQDGTMVMLLENDFRINFPPYAFIIQKRLNGISYKIKGKESTSIAIEGKLVAVKRKMKNITYENIIY